MSEGNTLEIFTHHKLFSIVVKVEIFTLFSRCFNY